MLTRTPTSEPVGIFQPLSFYNNRWVRRLVVLLVGLGLVALLNQIERDTQITLEQTRPIVTLIAVVLAVVAAWGLVNGCRIILQNNRQLAWRMSFKMVGWVGMLGGAVGVIILLLARDSDPRSLPFGGAVRAVESVVPLVVGIQAAFLFSPDDEPAIEVMAACPRWLSWVLLERLVVLFIMQTLLAVVGMLFSLGLRLDQSLIMMLARWVAPIWFFAGISAYTTLRSRQPAFSILVVGLIWFVCNFMGGALLPGTPTFWPLSLLQPFLWSINTSLQPEYLTIHDYWLNRLVIAGLGIVLLMLTARQIRDVEAVFAGLRSKQSSGRSQMNSIQLMQLLGMVRYEFRLYWRRWALWILVWAMLVVLALYIILGGDSLAMLNQIDAPVDKVREALTAAIVFSTWAPVGVALIFALPVLVCDTIPLDRQYNVSDLLQSLPLSPAIYILGKLLGLWISVLAGMAAVMVVVGAVWWFKVGAFNLGPYLEMWVVGVGMVSLLNGGLGLLAGSFYSSRRQAILLTVIAWVVIFAIFAGSFAQQNFLGVVSPIRGLIINYYIFNTRQLLDPVPSNLLSSPQAVILTIVAGLAEIVLLAGLSLRWKRWRETRS